jgi:hypothetical protein
LRTAICNEDSRESGAVGICGDEGNCAGAEAAWSGENVAVRIVDGELATGITCGHQDFGLVACTRHGTEAILKKLRPGRRQVRQRVRGRCPKGEQRFASLGLAKAHHQVAVGKCEQFFRAIEEGIGKRLQSSDFIACSNLQRSGIDCGYLFRDCANPNGGAVRRKIGATRAWNADFGDASGGRR